MCVETDVRLTRANQRFFPHRTPGLLLKQFQGHRLRRFPWTRLIFVSCRSKVTSFFFQNGTVRLIYSYHDFEPPGLYGERSLPYHGPSQRGTRSLNLIEMSTSEDAPSEDTLTWDLRNPEVNNLVLCLNVSDHGVFNKYHYYFQHSLLPVVLPN
jgi:hypothetical protein